MVRILVALSHRVVIELLTGARNHGNLPIDVGIAFAQIQIVDSEASAKKFEPGSENERSRHQIF
jgi:hypothetical protein